MARVSRRQGSRTPEEGLWRAALYPRLSREDGDKQESDSIGNQRKLLERYLREHPDMTLVDVYTDDGYTGTNFDRPGFRRMIRDIEEGRVNCVIVKDLSRLGRDYIKTGEYLQNWFPAHGVRFIALNENIDSEDGPYDILLPFRNVMNEQYARDISRKVRASIQIKQQNGEFIGAFACYGYRKDPENHNRLLIDPPAAAVVRRIFTLYEQGMGKIGIAKRLNVEEIPCPSEYKRLNGEKYHNGQRLGGTSYWTYATIHRILKNQMYAGRMEQGRAPRQGMHGKSRQLPREQWAVVEGTHQAIIGPEQWGRVQSLLLRDTRILQFEENVSPFAGFLRCGDCGRAMSKTSRSGGVYYCCGSYKRYGPGVCTQHGIAHRDLERLVLEDLNRVISSVGDLEVLAREAQGDDGDQERRAEGKRLAGSLERLRRLRREAYEDYKDGLLSKEDYLQYREDYQGQENRLAAEIKRLENRKEIPQESSWIGQLLERGGLTRLDRATVAEGVKEILVYEDHVEITYNFFDDMGIWGEQEKPEVEKK